MVSARRYHCAPICGEGWASPETGRAQNDGQASPRTSRSPVEPASVDDDELLAGGTARISVGDGRYHHRDRDPSVTGVRVNAGRAKGPDDDSSVPKLLQSSREPLRDHLRLSVGAQLRLNIRTDVETVSAEL